jgi:hypothetical protein
LHGEGRPEIISPEPLPEDFELTQRGRVEEHHLPLDKAVIQELFGVLRWDVR